MASRWRDLIAFCSPQSFLFTPRAGRAVFLLGIVLLLAGLAGCGTLIPTQTPTPSPQVRRGRAVFDSYCSRCHSASGDTVIVGPSLDGIATRGKERVPDMPARDYIRQSILDPAAYLVEGFPEDLMPRDFATQIPADDLDALIEFLLTLE